MAIVARRGSGKTVLLSDILISNKGRFALVVIVSPTIDLQDEFWADIDARGILCFRELSNELVESLREFMLTEEMKGEEILLCLDDLGFEARTKSGEELDRLVFIARHYHISCVQLAQKYTQLSPSMRSQLDQLYLFYCCHGPSLSMIHQEFGVTKTFHEFRDEVLSLKAYELILLESIGGRVDMFRL